MAHDVDEPIAVVTYDPAWPLLFDEEARRLRAGTLQHVGAIVHVGSTAVPGMVGKPIVDLIVGVADMSSAHRVAKDIEALGYENFGEIFIPGRVYLRRRGVQQFNVAITVENGEFWRTQILLRDYLRLHPEEAEAYSQNKLAAVSAGATMFSSYSQSKLTFLIELIKRAEHWSATGP